uniref:Shikimate O-hydroxycinnamoyltransferase-like n=1 Tax=Rhizophora mucronata TaxID=61149 RepID=A0A2P2KYK9_RHIMU
MKIEIKESSIVRPAEDAPNQRLWLSRLDLLYTKRGYIPQVYFYRHNGSSNFFEAKVLKEALSKVLVMYYPVAGRFAVDENGRIEINCNGEGALFVEADTDSDLDDHGPDFTPGEQLMQLIPPTGFNYSSDSELSSYPLLLVQVTRFTCGGVSLGIGCHHNLADGAGGLYFFNAWSSIARGLPVKVEPVIDRTILRPRVPPTPTPAFDHLEFAQAPVMSKTTTTSQIQSDSEANSTAIFKITLDQVNALKAMTNSSQSNKRYSTNEVLAAYIWRTTCKARDLPVGQATMLSIPLDGRSRLHPPLPPSYFGNVIFRVTVVALSGELLSEPFTKTIERIHEAIKRRDDGYLRSAIDYIEALGDINSVMRGPQSCQCPNLNFTSWLRLPFHRVDFSWGNPICIRPGSVFKGKLYSLPSPTNDGSVSLVICLEPEPMQSFQKLFYASFPENHTETVAN